MASDRSRVLDCIHGTMVEHNTRQRGLDVIWHRNPGEVADCFQGEGVTSEEPPSGPVAPTLPGTIDITFGTNGFSTVTPGTYDAIYALAIQPDGKIVAGGFCTSNSLVIFALARYNINGSFDTTFATKGYTLFTPGVGNGDQINSVAIQSNGKIVVGGYSSDVSGNNHYAVGRYNTDGSLDTTFGTNGYNITTPGLSDIIHSIAIQSDGKIIAGGTSWTGSKGAFVLTRYNTNGSRDTTFGTNGYNSTSLGTNDTIYSVAIQSDGKIIVGGSSTLAGPQAVFTLARYNTNGSLDTTFGTNGFNTTTPATSDLIRSIAIQSDGKIVAGGSANTGSATFAVTRYNINGSLDTTFGTSGYNLATPDHSDGIYSIALQSDGKIIAGGYATTAQGKSYFAVARYNTDGSLDTTFGTNGFNTTTPGTLGDYVEAMAVLLDGRIIAGGYTQNPAGTFRFALACYVE